MPDQTNLAVESSTVIAPITPMGMLQIAVQQGADVAQMQQLMDLQERWEANEARKAYAAAFTAFKAIPLVLEKNKHVTFTTSKGTTEYNHATLDSIVKIIGAALSQHGLSHSWKTEQFDGGVIRVTCALMHVAGHNESVSLQAGADQSGGKNNIQAVASTVSYLERYTLLAITGQATKEMDNDGAGAPPALITADQVEEIKALANEVGANYGDFLSYIGVATFPEIPANWYGNAIAALKKKGADKK